MRTGAGAERRRGGAIRRAVAGALALGLALGGCSSIGPQRLGIDRSDYANHLRETNKEQLLLNIVAMRYGDAPLFLDVTSVISQYTREGSVRVDVPFAPPVDDTEGSIGGSVLLRETPTITYTPLSGDRFARSMLSPIPPASLLGMIEAGWSAGDVFPLAVRSINGVRNGGRDPLFADPGDARFPQVTAALERLQRSHGLVFHIERGEGGRFTASASLSTSLDAAARADIDFLVRTLRLPGDGRELRIVFAADQTAPAQLAIASRSMFEIFSEMAQGVEVPPGDRDGRAVGPEGATAANRPLIRVHSGRAAPADAHAAVRYRGHWFWIDGTDTASKRAFLIAQILLSLNDTSNSGGAPLVTIPAG